MPRKNYPLWNKICSEPKLVDAKVHEWSSGEELESTLLNLINKLAIAQEVPTKGEDTGYSPLPQ